MARCVHDGQVCLSSRKPCQMNQNTNSAPYPSTAFQWALHVGQYWDGDPVSPYLRATMHLSKASLLVSRQMAAVSHRRRSLPCVSPTCKYPREKGFLLYLCPVSGIGGKLYVASLRHHRRINFDYAAISILGKQGRGCAPGGGRCLNM